MAVVRKPNEDFESMFRRFNRQVNDSGVLSELRKREYYRSKSVKRRDKRKEAEAKRRKFERTQRRFSYRSSYNGDKGGANASVSKD